MIYLQETTAWASDWVPNHTYYVSDDRRKMVGYIKAGTKKMIKFSKPMNFDVKGRKFSVLAVKGEKDEIYFPKNNAKPMGLVTEIAGSGGKIYYVSKIGNRYTCTCPGFMFRHKCKHVEVK